jgi:3-dehydroquinate dehydratase
MTIIERRNRLVTREEAREKAQYRVFVDFTRGDIEEECQKRGIKVTKSRSTMEAKLIEALSNEYEKQSSERL